MNEQRAMTIRPGWIDFSLALTPHWGCKQRPAMATVHEVDALVRQRPGISLDELLLTFGHCVYRSLKRLELVRYIERVRSGNKIVFYPVEQPTDMTVLLG
jgi:hypothetical protein